MHYYQLMMIDDPDPNVVKRALRGGIRERHAPHYKGIPVTPQSVQQLSVAAGDSTRLST